MTLLTKKMIIANLEYMIYADTMGMENNQEIVERIITHCQKFETFIPFDNFEKASDLIGGLPIVPYYKSFEEFQKDYSPALELIGFNFGATKEETAQILLNL
jgi:UDP-N-acetylglucosamine pyrophosphorylase